MDAPNIQGQFCDTMTDHSAPLRVLYVDDDEMALTLTQLQLIKAGVHTEATSDPLEAITILSTEPIDVILLDSVMPNIDGLEFLHLMRSLSLEVPVVFFTGFGLEELKSAVDGFNVIGFLDKQEHRFSLPTMLEQLLEDHRNSPVSLPGN